MTLPLPGYYPNVMRLLRRLNVPLRCTNFTFSFATAHQARHPFLLYNGQNGLRGFSLPTSRQGTPDTPRRRTLRPLLGHWYLVLLLVASYLFLVALALYHHLCGHLLDPGHPLARESLQRWTARHERLLHPVFVHAVVVTLFSAMATSSQAAVLEMPVSEVLLYIATTFLRDHMAVQGGVQVVQEALIKHVDQANIHLAAAVQRLEVEDTPDGQRAVVVVEGAQGGRPAPQRFRGFAHVILATPAMLSAALLQSYMVSVKAHDDAHATAAPRLAAMQAQLARVHYQKSTVVTHGDPSFLPAHRTEWRQLNLVAPTASPRHDAIDKANEDKLAVSHAMATHLLHDGADGQPLLLQTTNPSRWPAKETIYGSSTFQRAMTLARKDGQQGLFAWRRSSCSLARRCRAKVQQLLRRTNAPQQTPSSALPLYSDWTTTLSSLGNPWTLHLGDLQTSQTDTQQPCMWVCGSYAQGIPLLEGCVTSSTLVAAEILARSPRATVSHNDKCRMPV